MMAAATGVSTSAEQAVEIVRLLVSKVPRSGTPSTPP